MSLLPLPPATRTLGASAIQVSPIAWGMWRLAEDGRSAAEAALLVHAALDAGITLLDTADIYGFDGQNGFGDAEALLGEVLAAHPRLLVMSDDIYAPLRYSEGRHATLAVECPDLAERILTVSGVSKSHAMTGFRIGVAAGPAWLVGAMGKLQSHVSGNACSISQAGAVAAFEGPQGFLLDWRDRFRARRDLCVSAINAIPGLYTPTPDGAFYCMVDAAPLMARFGNDDALALQLLEHGVAIVAASGFGGKDGFRISFAADEAKLEEAMRRIAKAVSPVSGQKS